MVGIPSPKGGSTPNEKFPLVLLQAKVVGFTQAFLVDKIDISVSISSPSSEGGGYGNNLPLQRVGR